jgi:hypothetical protein
VEDENDGEDNDGDDDDDEVEEEEEGNAETDAIDEDMLPLLLCFESFVCIPLIYLPGYHPNSFLLFSSDGVLDISKTVALKTL